MGNMKQGDIIAVWFSCGAASAVAAKKTIEKYGDIATIRVINTPVKEEHEDNQRFLKDVEKWIGQSIETAVNPKYPESSCVPIWDKGFMSSPYGAPCTKELKKGARQHWEDTNKHDHLVLGFTKDEEKRHAMFALTERGNVLPVLIDEGLTKQDCYNMILKAGIKPPFIYKLGFPNANCIGCVKATSPTYWNHVRKHFPEVFEARAKQSRKIGCKLTRVKGKRIFLDELNPEIRGNSMKSMEVDCGIFCEEFKRGEDEQ